MSVNKLQALNNIAIKLGGLVQAVNEIQAIDNINDLIPAGGLPTSGLYTPSTSGLNNLIVAVAFQARFTRIGNMVMVSGGLSLRPTAAGQWFFSMLLPIFSNLANNQQLSGAMNVEISNGIAPQFVRGDSASNSAVFLGNSTGVPPAAVEGSYVLTYEVVLP